MGRITGKIDCNSGYKYVGNAGETVAAYIEAIEKEKRRTEIANELEERIANLELYKEYKGLC